MASILSFSPCRSCVFCHSSPNCFSGIPGSMCSALCGMLTVPPSVSLPGSLWLLFGTIHSRYAVPLPFLFGAAYYGASGIHIGGTSIGKPWFSLHSISHTEGEEHRTQDSHVCPGLLTPGTSSRISQNYPQVQRFARKTQKSPRSPLYSLSYLKAHRSEEARDVGLKVFQHEDCVSWAAHQPASVWAT